MVTYQRMAVLIVVTVNVAIATLIYYRIGQDHLFEIARNSGSGPFTEVIGMLAGIAPVALAIIELGTILWVIAGGVQEERAVMRGPRR